MDFKDYGMEVIQILICEDEPLIANRLARFIENVTTYDYKIKVTTTLFEAFEFLANNKIDLLFLDLNLHGKDGFEILKKVASASFHTIVVSAYTDRAIEAFDYGVLDFIGKPFAQERIEKALRRYKKGNRDASNHLKYLAVKSRKGVDFIDLNKVNYMKAAGIYSEVVLLDGSVKVYDKPLNQTLKLLPKNFMRVHKSYVVPRTSITSILKRKINSFDVLLKSGDRVPISRDIRKELLKDLCHKPR